MKKKYISTLIRLIVTKPIRGYHLQCELDKPMTADETAGGNLVTIFNQLRYTSANRNLNKEQRPISQCTVQTSANNGQNDTLSLTFTGIELETSGSLLRITLYAHCTRFPKASGIGFVKRGWQRANSFFELLKKNIDVQNTLFCQGIIFCKYFNLL